MTEIQLKHRYTAKRDLNLVLGHNAVQIPEGEEVVICSVRRDNGVDVASFSVPCYGVICTMTQVEFGQSFDLLNHDRNAPTVQIELPTEKPKKKRRGRPQKKKK